MRTHRAQTAAKGGYSYWDAPAFIPEACYGQNAAYSNNWCGAGPSGNSNEWSDHVRIPHGISPYDPNITYSYAPILDDILNCKLPAVSWVIPDGAYSDHPRYPHTGTLAVGPHWVGDIVDTVGQSYQLTSHNCDYWGIGTGSSSSEPTAIFVVWDDWGGWFDHVKPFTARQYNPHTGYTACDPTTQWGCGYTDGFRVPLLVVSPYTQPNYVSGTCGTGTPYSCPNDVFPYVHDFGSLLAFTEWNFGFNPQFIAAPNYADYNAPDWGSQRSNIPLIDFFTQGGRSFTQITTSYDNQCFRFHSGSNCPTGLLSGSWTASDPDDY